MKRRENFKISVVVPTFNEGKNVLVLAEHLSPLLGKYADWQIIFVDDGSRDDTLAYLRGLSETDHHIRFISLSRNFGHQKALKAGLDHADGDCAISMDADMQHPPELLDTLIAHWVNGYDIVTTIREDQKSVSLFKRATSSLFYKLINVISEVEIKPSASDFRLLDRTILDVLKEMNENHLFLRGLIPWLGFSECSVRYTPPERFSGTSKYSTKKMVSFALDGITSFSLKPLIISAQIGALVSLSAFLYGLVAIAAKLFYGFPVTGWTSVIISILFIGGLHLLMLGILGLYIGKIFMESKKRPNYVIKESNLL